MNIQEALNVFGLSGDLTEKDIKAAYKKAALKYHPDRNPLGAELMKAVNAAFDFLMAKEGANKRGNSSRLTQSFHFFMFEPIFSPVNALNQPI